jgi:hypothetical protein
MDLLIDTRDFILICAGAVWALWEVAKMYRLRKNSKPYLKTLDAKKLQINLNRLRDKAYQEAKAKIANKYY